MKVNEKSNEITAIPKILQTLEKDHGRIEKRKYFLINDLSWLEGKEKWKGLNSVGLVVSNRKIDGKTSTENRFYISSLKSGVEKFAQGVRSHWEVESMHWILDVCFQEDQCRKRAGKSSENFAIMRHMAINFLKKEKSYKAGIVRKQFKAALDEGYLEKVLLFN